MRGRRALAQPGGLFGEARADEVGDVASVGYVKAKARVDLVHGTAPLRFVGPVVVAERHPDQKDDIALLFTHKVSLTARRAGAMRRMLCRPRCGG